MFKKMKSTAAVIGVAAVAALGAAAPASAGTAVITSGGLVSTSAPSLRIVINGSVAFNCLSGGTTATVSNGSFTGTPVALVSSNVLASFANCLGPLGLAFTVNCTNTAQLGVTGNTAGGITPGVLRNISCVISFPAIGATANLSGSVNRSYNNTGVLTVLSSGQSLTVSGSTAPGIVPNGTAVIGGTGSGSLGVTNLPYTAGAVKPQIAATGF